MKQHALLVLRIAIAVAGIGYIAWSLTWSDHVVLPSDAVRWMADDPRLQPGMLLPVLSGSPELQGPATAVLVRLPDGSAMTLDPQVFGEEPDQAHFRPGIVATLRQADMGLLGLGLALVSLVYPIQTVRWWLLLRARGLAITLRQAFRLLMIGCFFNYCMPGTTGGDVVKAYYAAKGSDRRADAVVSVIVDRVAGLLGLLMLGGIAGLVMLHDPLARSITGWVWSGFLGFAICTGIYFSRRLRRVLGIEWVLARLPFSRLLVAVDAATVAYRNHKTVVFVAVLMSIAVHLILCVSAALAGFALGLDQPLGLLLTVLPILLLAAAIPLTYQGLGVMEGLAMALLLAPPAATANQLVGMLLLIRLFQIIYSLGGAMFVLRGNMHMHAIPAEATSVAG